MKTTSAQHSEEMLLGKPNAFQKVSDICSGVNSVKDENELLTQNLGQLLELFSARRGSIFIFNARRKELDLKVSKGMATAEQKHLVKRMGEGVVGKVAELKQPIVVDDISKDDRFHNYHARGSYRSPSFICAPLLLKDQLLGVISIADKVSGQRFSKDELLLLDFLSSQIALNYKRIKLYKKFRNVIKEAQSLKNALGKKSDEANQLRKQIVVQEKFASIGKLAGGIAHEFNNPLDGVIRYTNLSLEHLKNDDVVRGYLLEIRQGLHRMANIVRNLLACSRNTQASMQKVDVNHRIEQVVNGLQSDFFMKGINLRKDFSKDIPLVVDLGLDLIFSNLLRNAIDAVKSGGTIKISTRFAQEVLTIRVEDNGCGIPSEMMEQIFEPFFTTKDIEKGCGLGLTIVDEIVKSYGGRIHLESAPDKGTAFTITLPAKVSTYAKKH